MIRPLHLLLTCSLVTNAALGWLALRLQSSHLNKSSVLNAADTNQPAIPPHPLMSQAVPPADSKTSPVVNWHTLEAPDFATYIANLRRAGFPEPTIRRLIEPELHAVFEARRQNPLTNLSEPCSPEDEAATLAALLDSDESEELSKSLETAQANLVLPFAPAAFLVGNAATDLAFQDNALSITPTDTSLAPETVQTLTDMRRQFGDQVSVSNSSPSSHEYYLQWLKAQRTSDDYFASLYGGDHFIRVQQQANVQRVQHNQVNAAQVTKPSN
jgi:hypothetical protein